MTGQASSSESLSERADSLSSSLSSPSMKFFSYVPGLGLLEMSLQVVTPDLSRPTEHCVGQLVIPGMEHWNL